MADKKATEVQEPCKTCKRTVLLAVDGSDQSNRAIEWFLDHVYRPGSDHVVLYHAFELPTTAIASYPYGFTYYEQWMDILDKADEEANHMLERSGKICHRRVCGQHEHLKDKHVDMFKERDVPPGQGICKMARDCHADVIVMGTRGLGTLRRTILGSNSDYVLHHAHIPTVIVPDHHGQQQQQQHQA